MNNNWIVLEDTKFAEWQITFPIQVFYTDALNILNFAMALLKAGENENVYTLQAQQDAPLKNTISEISVLWNKTLEEENRISLFDLQFNETWKWIISTASHICYFDKAGKIKEAAVNNIGTFLKELNRNSEMYSEGFREDAGAITLLSNDVSIHKKNSGQYNPVVFNISLRTDIWFPKVLGLGLQNELDFSPKLKWYDNSALAFCHTPRLNNFLSQVRELALSHSGKWQLLQPENIAKNYEPMVSEYRIII